MKDNFWKKVVMGVLILALCASTALAQEQRKGPPPLPPPPAQCLVDSNGYLYVLIGPSILQYKLPDMTGPKTVTLPAPEDSKQVNISVQKPPMPPGLSWLISETSDGEYLYVVAPGYIFQYSVPGLELVQKQALPRPETPK